MAWTVCVRVAFAGVVTVIVMLSLASAPDAMTRNSEPLPTPPSTSAPPSRVPRNEGDGVTKQEIPSHPTKLRKSGEANQCLLVQGELMGTPATQFNCDTFRDQYWYFDGPYDYGDGVLWWQLRNMNSGKCLMSQDAADTKLIVQAECDNRSLNQYWSMSADSSTPSWITNLNHAKCIAVFAPDPGLEAIQVECESRVADQLFTRVDHY
jgi:hypothetical protein